MLGSAIETPGLRRELEKAENLVLVLAHALLSLLVRLMVLGLGIHGSGGGGGRTENWNNLTAAASPREEKSPQSRSGRRLVCNTVHYRT